MGADTPWKLGELLFKFVQWRIEPPTIDLTGDASPEMFVPLEGTGLVLDPKDEEIPEELLNVIKNGVTF